ncbi:ArsR/SmtB family transcription factor [Paenibacillus dendritiformis]|uniref:ArsR/SmtB family transcription factor n=1 Tax=Paenibacillus dendritiformis TaxID=130049 RepID=UPI000DA99A0B|nr:winged helix-turn-helix domain-containing protein [Paenibacillus dendritiformis]PZM63679.1 ArsR family transcriptional regulator [Paenibacillus dendritiformis]
MTYHVRIDYSSVYELIGSFMLFVHRKWIRNVENGMEWARSIEQQLPPQWNAYSEKIRKHSLSDFDMLYALALERNHNDIPSYLEQLELLTPAKWDRVGLENGLRLGSFRLERCLELYVPALRFWYEHYIRHSLPEWEPILLHDAEEKRRLLDKIKPQDLIELATNGVVIPEHESLDEVILAPMWHYRPINNNCTFRSRILILYPVDKPEPDLMVPSHNLRRMTEALANEKRLRILRLVGQKPYTFDEIQEYIPLSTGALKHHLAVLRSAGYIRTYWNGKVQRIALRPEGLADLSAFLEAYIHS